MGFLNKLDAFINEKGKQLEDAINQATNSMNNVDLNGLIDNAGQKLGEFVGEAGAACKGLASEIEGYINTAGQTGQAADSGNINTNNAVQTPVNSTNAAEIIPDIDKFAGTKSGLSLDKEVEQEITSGLNLHNEEKAVVGLDSEKPKVGVRLKK